LTCSIALLLTVGSTQRKRKRWSILKVLYFVIRYFGDIVLICDSCVFLNTRALSPHACAQFIRFQAWSTCITIWCMQAILQFRIYAMYDHCKRILCLIVVLYLAEIASMAAILEFSGKFISVQQRPIYGQARGCSPSQRPRFYYALWLPVVSYETILFLLAVFKGIREIMDIRTLRRTTGSSLLHILVRDNIMYFFLTLAAYVTCQAYGYRSPRFGLKSPKDSRWQQRRLWAVVLYFTCESIFISCMMQGQVSNISKWAILARDSSRDSDLPGLALS